VKNEKKKKPKRSKKKHAALDPAYNIKLRYDLIDYDYLDKLSEEELDWLNKFQKEYVNASVGKHSEAAESDQLHNTPELAKDCTDRNNWRNNDIYGVSKATHQLRDISKDEVKKILDTKTPNPEDFYIDCIDYNSFNKKKKD